MVGDYEYGHHGHDHRNGDGEDHEEGDSSTGGFFTSPPRPGVVERSGHGSGGRISLSNSMMTVRRRSGFYPTFQTPVEDENDDRSNHHSSKDSLDLDDVNDDMNDEDELGRGQRGSQRYPPRRERLDSFSSLGESVFTNQQSIRKRMSIRRNSLFSYTSATHSLATGRREDRSSIGYRRRAEPSFVTAYEEHGDSISMTEVSDHGSRRHGTNLDVRNSIH